MLAKILSALQGKKTNSVVIAIILCLAARHFNFVISEDVFYLLGALGLAAVRDAIAKINKGDFTDVTAAIIEEAGVLSSKTK